MVKWRDLGLRVYTLNLAHIVAFLKKRNCRFLVYEWEVWLNPGWILNTLVHPSFKICKIPHILIHLLSTIGRWFSNLFTNFFILPIINKVFLLIGYNSISSLASLFRNILKSSPRSTSISISTTRKRYSLLNSIMDCFLFYVGKWKILIVPLLKKRYLDI